MIQLPFPTTDSSDRTNRAVAEVIGFILLFGLVIAGISLVQLYGVPAQNERIEFDHNLRAQDDMAVFADNIQTAGLSGSSVSTTIETGTDYPSKLFLFNPPAPTGSIRLGSATTVRLSNATATGEVGDYWNGTDRSFTTRPIVYQPSYNVYDGAPKTVIEHGVVYNDNPNGGPTVLKQGSLVRGNRISLVTVSGTYSRGGLKSQSLEAVPVSAPTRTVTLTPTEPLTLTLESRLSVSDWEQILSEERASGDGHVTSVTSGPTSGTVSITLEPGVSYQLNLARVGIETGYDAKPGPTYLTTVDRETISTGETATTTVTFEARDAYDNPVAGVTVRAGTRLSGSTLTPKTATTDGDGRVTFTYKAPSVSGVRVRTDSVVASIDPSVTLDGTFDPRTPENAAVSVSVSNTDGSGVQTGTVGEGGESDWSEGENTQQITVPNGRWNDISHIESITLSDGQMVTVERCVSGTSTQGNNPTVFTECKFVDTLRLSFSVTNATDKYTADVTLVDCNQDGDFTDTCKIDKLSINEERSVTLYDNGGGIILKQSLDSQGTQGIFTDAGTNLLDANSYTTASQPTLDRLKLDDGTWLTGVVQGRVTVTVSSAS